MEGCDALIVGGGPAGSTVARKLAHAGLNVLLLERERYPREKLCGGWITPEVVEDLALDLSEYAKGRILQPITGFRSGRIGAHSIETRYGAPVSYGIRRCEFDFFLAGRSGARVMDATPVSTIGRTREGWVINDRFRAPLLVGAGGHNCPVARTLGANPGREAAVVARETEFLLDEEQRRTCPVRGETPELYFCRDMKGYGWCFRKGDYLNVGLGRMDHRGLKNHLSGFLDWLRGMKRVPDVIPGRFAGHAYLLCGSSRRKRVTAGAILVGDAAGLAFQRSGEGIRPAVDSAILAAGVILAANGEYSRDRLQAYDDLLELRFRRSAAGWAGMLVNLCPGRLIEAIASGLLSNRSFTRRILLDRWFLRSGKRES
jgi:geranylgeranyl reductase family protein